MGYIPEREMLVELYVEKQLDQSEVAETLDIRPNDVSCLLHLYEIPRRKKSYKYTEDELIEQIKQLADEKGHSPSRKEIKESEITPAPNTYRRRFGDWKKAVKKAGLDLRVGRLPKSDD